MDGAGIEELTQRACDAARQGRWDLVEQLYGERGSELAAVPLSSEERLRILALDREVQGQATVARAALASSLLETARQRQRLEEIRRRVGASVRDSSTILLQA